MTEEIQTPKPECLVPECSGVASIRGLCRRCYGKARALVKAEKVTWPRLVVLGLAAESKRDEVKNDPFGEALTAAEFEEALINPTSEGNVAFDAPVAQDIAQDMPWQQ